MKDGKCRNCGKETVFQRKDRTFFDLTIAHKTPLGRASYGVFADYVCTACGYTESYIEDDKALAVIKAEWEPVK